LFLFVAGIILVLDQATKAWIYSRFPFPTYGHPGHLSVIDGFFNIVHVGNTGAAWSLFTGRSPLLALLALITLLVIFLYRHRLGLRQLPVQVAFGLLCGGIVGNLIDRIVHGHVIDFIDLHFGSYIYPTFNVADSGICMGVACYLIYSLRHPEPPQS